MYNLLLPSLLFAALSTVPQERGPATFGLRQVKEAAVTQYWKNRCVDEAVIDTGDVINLFPTLPILDVYIEVKEEIYFVMQLDRAGGINRRELAELAELIVGEKKTVFYLVAPDETNPGAGRVDLASGLVDARCGCATHLPILAPWKNERLPAKGW